MTNRTQHMGMEVVRGLAAKPAIKSTAEEHKGGRGKTIVRLVKRTSKRGRR